MSTRENVELALVNAPVDYALECLVDRRSDVLGIGRDDGGYTAWFFVSYEKVVGKGHSRDCCRQQIAMRPVVAGNVKRIVVIRCLTFKGEAAS